MTGTPNLPRSCRRLLRELGIRPPLEVSQLCERVAQHRGRAIRRVACDIPAGGPFGAWLSGARTDYILFQQSTSPVHQDHIVLHELAHILARDLGASAEDAARAEKTAIAAPERWTGSVGGAEPELDMDAVHRALRTGRYDLAHERDAETVATIILVWRTLQESIGIEPGDQRFAALGDVVGWGI